MRAKGLYQKLARYEQEAYKAGMGEDWLQEVGEHTKHYFQKCALESKKPSIKGLIERIDRLADWFLFDIGERP